jgi:hypothetical protein
MEICSSCGLSVEGQKPKHFAGNVYHKKCFKLLKKEVKKKIWSK